MNTAGGNIMALRDPVVAAQSVVDLVRSHRDSAERRFRMAPEVAAAFSETGLFRLGAPAQLGGYEASLGQVFETLECLATADPGAAWHLCNSVVSGLAGASIGATERALLYEFPECHSGFSAVPGGTAVPVADGYTISGFWPFVTGALDARWLGLTAAIRDTDGPRLLNGTPETRTFFVRAADVSVDNTWNDVMGLRSSGSHAVRADAALSPAALSYSFSDPRPVLDGALYRVAPYQVFWITAVGVVFGIWRSAVDGMAETVSGKRSSMDGSLGIDLPTVQWALAEADTERRVWRGGILDAAEQVMDAAAARGTTTAAERSQLWTSMILSTDRARESISRLYAAGTTVAWRQGQPLERAVRDVHAVSVAFERFRRLVFDAGRVIAGLDPQIPLF